MTLEQEIDAANLARIAPALKATILPSIHLEHRPVQAGTLAVGASKLGFLADLPPGVTWPARSGERMEFIARLNLAEMAPYDLDHLLPSSGMLYFFLHVDHHWNPTVPDAGGPLPWGTRRDDRGRSRVVYVPTPPSGYGPEAAAAGDPRSTEFGLSFSPVRTLPPSESPVIDMLHLSHSESAAYSQLRARVAPQALERVLGYPDQIQGDMQAVCRTMNDDQGSRWILLLQLDSDDSLGWMWGDSGRLYYWIREEDLRQRNFENVWTIIQD